MPKGKPLTEEAKERIYGMYLSGMSQKEVGELFGIHSGTVSNVVCEQRRKQEEKGVAYKSQIVAGDKTNGRLISLQDPKRYEGTCIVGGKSKRRSFTAPSPHDAQQQWEKWCTTLRDEQQFMDMVERKGEPLEESKEEVDVTPAPVPEITVRPWKEVAEEREQEIERLKAELEEAKTQRIEFAEGFQMEEHNPTYLIWTKQPEVRLYGLYLTMDAALKEVDRLNDVAKFLGQGGAFEVEEVAWRG